MVDDAVPLPMPIEVALAITVHVLPTEPDLRYEGKFDGHRTVVIRTRSRVLIQTRSGRLTGSFPELAEAAAALPPGTVLDGEAVVWSAGRLDFSAVQQRAASTPRRAAVLARSRPASFAAFDLLAQDGNDLRRLPLDERRARLVDLLAPLGPPLQPVPQTDDPAQAADWYEHLPAAGLEGLVIKRAGAPYRPGRASGWRKLRHSETIEAAVVGTLGPPRRPRALLLQLPDRPGPVRSAPLTPVLSAQLAALLRQADVPPVPADDGTPYRPVPPGVEVEVLAGSTRHAAVIVTRLRISG